MFKEIVRNYALQQLDFSSFVIQINPLLLGKNKAIEATEHVKMTRSSLENREYTKISCENNTWLTVSLRLAIFYLREQYGEVITACQSGKLDKDIADFFVSITELKKENSSVAFAKLIELSSYKSKLPAILKDPLAGVINELYTLNSATL